MTAEGAPSRPRPRRARPRLGLLLLALALTLIAPSAAFGHAVLIDSSPADQEVVPAQPPRVTLGFSESVETSLGGIRVFDADAKRVDTGDPFRAGTDTVAVRLRPRLANGTYTVSWSVLSTDGHPVDGAFVFHIGAPGANPNGIASEVGGGASTGVRRAADVARFLNLALLVALIGSLGALLLVFHGADREVERRLWHTAAGIGFALAVAAGLTIVLEAAIVTGSSVGGATRGGTLSAVLDTRFGHVRLAQLIVAEVLAICAVWAATARGRAFKWTVGAMGVALAVLLSLSGHAGVNGGVAILADTVHILAASMWVGGLAAVVIGVWMAGERRGKLGRIVFPRFSTIALWSIVALLVAGTVSAFQNVDAIGELVTTTYGRLLLAKIGLAVTLIALGAVSRSAVSRLRAGDGETHVLRTSVRVELVLMLAALAVTSVLIAKPPAKAVSAATGPQSTTAAVADLRARVVLQPARVGSNTVEVFLAKAGAPQRADEVTVNARPAAGQQGPFRLILKPREPGHYVSPPLQATVPGPWTLEVAVRRGDFDLDSATVTLPIRSDIR